MSSSNIIVRVRYKTSANRTKGIKSWGKYVANKEKADSTLLDKNDVLDDYLNYLDKESFLNEKEESFLWSQNGDSNLLTDLSKQKLDNKGTLWDMVISFEPTFAYQKGLITKKDFYELTKNIMPTFLTSLGIDLNNCTWYAGLHRNTKNPHIHLIFYEHEIRNHFKVIPSANIWQLKSSIINYLIDNKDFYLLRDKEFKNITDKISFNELNKVKRQRLISDKYRRDLNKMLLSLYDKLPSQGRLQYNSKNLKPYKKELDSIINFILTNDPVKDNYQVYYNALEEHQKELNSNYGNSKYSQNDKYIKEQVHRLYSKIGNEILNNYKIYSSLEVMEKEISFLKKHIYEVKFRSRNDLSEKKIIEIGKSLYKVCNSCDLNSQQIKKVFTNWINKSKYNYDIDYLLDVCFTLDKDMSSTEYYKILNQLGYNYERLSKFKNKNFYKELNYKVFINSAINHLMYEYEKERKEIERELEYELEEL